jgi:hypothetical protein
MYASGYCSSWASRCYSAPGRVSAREILAGRNWRNLPMFGALTLLLVGNLLVHLEALDLAATAQFDNRLGLVTLLILISLVGGRIIPSFTPNWLAKARPEVSPPVSEGGFDLAVLALTGLAPAELGDCPGCCGDALGRAGRGDRCRATAVPLARPPHCSRAAAVDPSFRLWLAGPRPAVSRDRR